MTPKVTIMNTNDYLKQYVPLVDFIADICGPACEVVLHDVSVPEYSIVAIRNPLTGNIGVPLTGLTVDFTDPAVYEGRKFLTNYVEQVGDKRYLSSSYFIKKDGDLAGVLSINKDLTPIDECWLAAHGILAQYNMQMPKDEETGQPPSDTSPVVTLLHNMISNAINETGVPPTRMSLNEKVRLVHKLSDSGVLMIDGAISEIASRLGISEPTVYRYLNRRIN